MRLPVDGRHLTWRTSEAERGSPVLLPQGTGSREVSRWRCWLGRSEDRSKRRPGCTCPDTGFNVTRHESEPTSDWFGVSANFLHGFGRFKALGRMALS